MALTRRGYLVVFLVLAALAAVAGVYYRGRIDKAVADCAMPAPPEKAKTPPPNLPGFQSEAACGPGEQPQPPPGAGAKKKK